MRRVAENVDIELEGDREQKLVLISGMEALAM
jgi:hypothetical protein